MQTGISDDQIRAQIPHALQSTDFTGLGKRYQGKVRDSYVKGDKRVLIASDRISHTTSNGTSAPSDPACLTTRRQLSM